MQAFILYRAQAWYTSYCFPSLCTARKSILSSRKLKIICAITFLCTFLPLLRNNVTLSRQNDCKWFPWQRQCGYSKWIVCCWFCFRLAEWTKSLRSSKFHFLLLTSQNAARLHVCKACWFCIKFLFREDS